MRSFLSWSFLLSNQRLHLASSQLHAIECSSIGSAGWFLYSWDADIFHSFGECRTTQWDYDKLVKLFYPGNFVFSANGLKNSEDVCWARRVEYGKIFPIYLQVRLMKALLLIRTPKTTKIWMTVNGTLLLSIPPQQSLLPFLLKNIDSVFIECRQWPERRVWLSPRNLWSYYLILLKSLQLYRTW